MRRRATVSLQAILANAAVLTSALRQPIASAFADLRADAYGHGLAPVADALTAAGIGGFVVSDPDARGLLISRHPGVAVRIGAVDARPESGLERSGSALLGPELFGLGEYHSTLAPELRAALRPALCLTSEVLSIKRVRAGTGVSYGYTYRTVAETTLVLSGLGFADGIPRAASNRAPVLVGAVHSRVSGRIAMDQFVIDVGDAVPSVGDTVVLFGDGSAGEPTAADWARATGIRSEAIVAGLGARIERVYRR
ncbi:MAG: alanine racemase [Microbacteriaceae bacterium]|nr:MAG: alanine racemase [Microbacteriaceae bacterium]